MNSLFLTVLSMSITASYAAIAVIIIRMFLRHAPKIFFYALWTVVLFRLICPFSFESSFSLLSPLPSASKITTDVFYSYESQNNINFENKHSFDNTLNTENTALKDDIKIKTTKEIVPAPQTFYKLVLSLLPYVWLFGFAIILIYTAFSYFSLKRRVSTATLVKDNIFETDMISTPFVLGFIGPKIYIPLGINENELSYVLLHEQTHIKRFDYLIKPFAFLVISLHWFNPLMWLCYSLMSKDIEMSCDESVIKHTDLDIRENYSKSLLSLSIKQSKLLSPLAFGESNIKARIKNILNYKIPVFWIIIITIVAVGTASVLLMVNPKPNNDFRFYEKFSASEKFLKYKTEYVGDAPRVGNIIHLLTFPPNISYNSLELSTSNIPYSVNVYLKTDEINEITSKKDNFDKNAVIMFSLIDNVDNITFILTDSEKELPFLYTREWANYYTNKDVRTFSNGEVEFSQLLRLLKYAPAITENNIDIIMSSPKASSDPKDYINAHKEEYSEIITLDTEALYYMFSEFEKTEQTGLKGAIMEYACHSILGDENIKYFAASPKDRYYELKEHMQIIATKNSLEYVQKNYPKSSLILNKENYLYAFDIVNFSDETVEIAGEKLSYKKSDLAPLYNSLTSKQVEQIMYRAVVYYNSVYKKDFTTIDRFSSSQMKSDIDNWGKNEKTKYGADIMMQLDNYTDINFPIEISAPRQYSNKYTVNLKLDEVTSADITFEIFDETPLVTEFALFDIKI